MKKTFKLVHPKINYDRMVDAVKNEIRKYLRRERKRTLPEDTDFWDFDCRFGDTEDVAKEIHLAEIDAHIDAATSRKQESFYVEILAKPGVRTKKETETNAPPHWVKEMHTFSSAPKNDAED